jgi:ribosomal-protein-alanine N-acetyltransferase
VSVCLRLMLPGDLSAVLELERTLFPDDAWSPGMFETELGLEGRGRHYVAAEEGQTLVGYAGMMLPGGRQAEVLTLAVDAGHWGRGIGSALLTDLLGEAGRQNCTEMFLEVRADNPRAQDLYRRYGFDEIGIRRGYYQPSGVDAIVMRCALPAQPGQDLVSRRDDAHPDGAHRDDAGRGDADWDDADWDDAPPGGAGQAGAGW